VGARQIVPGVYAIPLGFVNAFLIETDHLTLIDTGLPGSAENILEAVRSLGRQPRDIRHILVTHCHPDHAGSLAALKQATGAPAYMHADDAAMVRKGLAMRPLKPVPGFIPGLLFRMFIGRASSTIPAARIEHEAGDGERLPAAGGIKAFHAAGHCAGQLVFLWPRHGGVLFVADAASNVMGLGLSLGYEDLERGKRSLIRIAALDFQVACFGHGRAILQQASTRFRRKWGRRPNP